MVRVVIGGAGAPNYGDELILKKWIQSAHDLDPSSEWLVFQSDLQKVKDLHHRFARRAARITFSDAVERVSTRGDDLDFWRQVIRGYRFLERDGARLHGEEILRKIEGASSVHLHGGGYLNRLSPSKGFWLGVAASAAKLSGTRCFATGIGFGPVAAPPSEHAQELAEVFGRFDTFELRDIESFRLLSGLFPHSNFMYGLDDCYLEIPDNFVTSGRKTLLLSFVAYNVRNLPKKFWGDLRSVAARYDQVTFLESYPWQDKDVFEFLKGEIGDCDKIGCREAIREPIPVGPGSFAITSRFHYHFILARCGVPGLYMQDTEYYRSKHQSIIDRGSRFLEYTPGDDLLSAVKVAETRMGSMHLNDRLLVEQKHALAKWIYRS